MNSISKLKTMVSKVTIKRHTLHFRTSFKIAYEEVDQAEVILVILEDEHGNRGFGSASPDIEVTGETLQGVEQILRKKLTLSFFDKSLHAVATFHPKIQQAFLGFPAAQSAAEEAWLNLFCAERKISMGSLFGNPKKSSPIMVTIGIKDEKQTQHEVRQRLKQGFRTIKLKVGLDLKTDLLRIRAARAEIPKTHRLVLDANQGYLFKDAEKLIHSLRNLDIALMEQPIAAEDWEGLKALHQQSAFPVIADESAISLNDARRLLMGDYVSGVNIKLMKCGGPINFAKICDLAKSLNKLIMIGCMYESNISITTGAHLALSLHLDYADLDSGAMDFDDDLTVGGAEVRRGMIAIKRPLGLK